jgi:hypothetical protein
MTKIVQLRVSVPVDDGVKVDRVQAELRNLIRAAGIVAIEAQSAPEGSLALGPTEPEAIFWPASDIKQGAVPGGRGNGTRGSAT